MRPSFTQLALPGFVSLFVGFTACSAPSAGPEDNNGGGGSNNPNDKTDNENTGTGSTGQKEDTNDDIITEQQDDTVNPCDLPNAPEECTLEAAPACGDGLINMDPPEACDDGNGIPGDGCSGSCNIGAHFECPTPGQPCVTTIVCGDAEVGPGEACDDGNATDGDGCSSTCTEIEPGFSCRIKGIPCVRVFVCGDGSLDPNEGCDDGGNDPGDGCSERCRMETGFKCEGSPSTCTPTTCGDSITEGAESCDDGNDIPFDGCNDLCQAEPECEGRDGCTSSCGDGIVLDEECDDGNLRDGDGCSSDCKVEGGFKCSDDGTGSCETLNGECILRVPALFRDFREDTVYSDFPGSTCNLTTGLVGESLDANDKPTFVGNACIKSVDSFSQWYTDNENNKTMPGNLVLFQNGDGGYVNRLGDDGAQFFAPTPQPLNDQPCAPDDDTCIPCQHVPTQTCGIILHDGNPMFFPLDNFADAWPDARKDAKVPQQVYGADGWPLESDWQYWPEGYDPTGDHNFLFSSEVQYWFRYVAADAATLEFAGDDDMWVFVNGNLAVDLGGVHTPEIGAVTIDATTGPNFGLEDGKVYPIKMFHAERKDPGSSFKLTLSGFTTGRSDCVTDCGDGNLGAGEECDDGPENTGGYNKCTPDCTLGPHCGDGLTQEGDEVCDPGTSENVGGYGECTASCTLGPYCGDGITTHDEECDDAINDGGYGECGQNCKIGPICGDGGWQPEFEDCDDGNNLDGDGCSAACKLETIVTQ